MNAKFGLALVISSVLLISCTQALTQQADAPVTIQANVNRVLVPVVVRDKHGNVVTDLKREDFHVFDNDKPRDISAFSFEARGGTHAANAGSSVQLSDTAPKPAAHSKRITIFLFDDLHLSIEDLALAKKAGVQALDTALSNSDVAGILSTSGRANSGLTRDSSKLQDAINGLQSHGVALSNAGDCPKLDYFQADLMEDKGDSAAKSEAVSQMFRCDPALDPQRDMQIAQRLAEAAAMRVLNTGRQDILATYANIGAIVRAMAKLPAERTLVLVSPGFLPIEEDGLSAESHLIDVAAESNVTISALDARGLYITSMTASDSPSGDPQYQSEIRRKGLERAESAMGELAYGTGGSFFHNSNDLTAGFKELSEAPEAVYVLELSIGDMKQDGSYHRLKVKLDRSGVDVQARLGYYMSKPEKIKK